MCILTLKVDQTAVGTKRDTLGDGTEAPARKIAIAPVWALCMGDCFWMKDKKVKQT
jgi:hypothetical protein